jgi:hypothetical protein
LFALAGSGAAMGIFDWFRGPTPIADRKALIDFLDSRAAFLAQKSVFDYARGRSGPHFTAMVKEQAFVAAVDEARWRNYPIALAIVVEMIHGVMLQEIGGDSAHLTEKLREASFAAFDRYPVPAALGSELWMESRATLASRVDAVALHAPKHVKDIPLQFAQAFYDNMPIHEQVRGRDFELIRNHVRVNLLNIHRDFKKSAVLDALAADLERPVGRTAA